MAVSSISDALGTVGTQAPLPPETPAPPPPEPAAPVEQAPAPLPEYEGTQVDVSA